jgi:putative hydrolase of the HAD superfamily
MFPFDVILFDVGGVLLTNGWDHGERAAVLSDFHLDLAEFEARHLEPYRAWESGAISAEAYLNATVFYAPRSFTQADFFALNNESRETNKYRFSHFGLCNCFRVALSSCYLGQRKPGPAIYQRALDILSRPAERILFIDDRLENVAGAVAAGMQGIRFEGAEMLRRELVKLGVL